MPKALTREQLFAEWRLLVSIVSTVLAVAGSYFLLRSDVSLLLYRVNVIESNHLTHIQASMEKMSGDMESLSIKEAENRTLLNQHLNQK